MGYSLIIDVISHIVCNMPSNSPFSKIRWFFFKNKLKKCNGFFNSGTGLYIPYPKNVTLGSGVSLASHVHINSGEKGEIIIGNNCLIGPFTVIRAEDHCYDSIDLAIRDQGHKPGLINLCEDCWICAHVTITRNVTIGKGSVIGANSVVTHDIPPYSVAVGAPAKVIKKRGSSKN